MNLLPWRREESRADPSISFQSWLELMSSFSYQGVSYSLPNAQQEEIRDYTALIRSAYKSCGVVFAVMDVRAKLFAEASFQWRNSSTTKMFGTPELAILENPWPGGTTGDLLYRVLQMVDLAGNAFIVRRGGGLALLRPDWTDIVSASPNTDASVWDIDAKVIGYLYHPRGRNVGGVPPVTLLPEQVAHFAPVSDPESRFRGTTWLWPVIREVMADKAATQHKLQFFENGATPNGLVKFNLDSVEKMKPWIELFRESHEGASNAYKTLFLGAGTDYTVVGANPEQIDFKITQGGGETRIAAAAGVPPVIVGLSEGLQAATYSNYSQARRRFADGTMRPLWRNLCGSLERILNVPSGAHLWYDDRDIPALKEDIQDKAQERRENAIAANNLVSAGYTRESIILYIDSDDPTDLVPDPDAGTSVQLLQPPAVDNVKTPALAKALPVGGDNGNGSEPDT
jgi:phage portal protein BeeE